MLSYSACDFWPRPVAHPTVALPILSLQRFCDWLDKH